MDFMKDFYIGVYFIHCFLSNNHEKVQQFSWSGLFNFDRLHLKNKKKKGTRFTHLLNRPHSLSPASPLAERSLHHVHSARSSSTLHRIAFRNESFLPLRQVFLALLLRGSVFADLSPGGEWLSLPSVWRGDQPTTQQIPPEHPRTVTPVPSHSSPSLASHCHPGLWGRRPYTCLRSLCHLRADRSDGCWPRPPPPSQQRTGSEGAPGRA